MQGDDKILLLHTFDEALALSDYTSAEHAQTATAGSIGNFFVLLIQRAADGSCRMRMWMLQVATRAFSATHDTDTLDAGHYYPTATPLAPSAALTCPTTTCVYDAPIEFDDDVQVRAAHRRSMLCALQVKSVTISAGHQSSASLYPTCRTPYLLLLACSDYSIRFMRCVRAPSSPLQQAQQSQYVWEAWRMIGQESASELTIRGARALFFDDKRNQRQFCRRHMRTCVGAQRPLFVRLLAARFTS